MRLSITPESSSIVGKYSSGVASLTTAINAFGQAHEAQHLVVPYRLLQLISNAANGIPGNIVVKLQATVGQDAKLRLDYKFGNETTGSAPIEASQSGFLTIDPVAVADDQAIDVPAALLALALKAMLPTMPTSLPASATAEAQKAFANYALVYGVENNGQPHLHFQCSSLDMRAFTFGITPTTSKATLPEGTSYAIPANICKALINLLPNSMVNVRIKFAERKMEATIGAQHNIITSLCDTNHAVGTKPRNLMQKFLPPSATVVINPALAATSIRNAYPLVGTQLETGAETAAPPDATVIELQFTASGKIICSVRNATDPKRLITFSLIGDLLHSEKPTDTSEDIVVAAFPLAISTQMKKVLDALTNMAQTGVQNAALHISQRKSPKSGNITTMLLITPVNTDTDAAQAMFCIVPENISLDHMQIATFGATLPPMPNNDNTDTAPSTTQETGISEPIAFEEVPATGDSAPTNG